MGGSWRAPLGDRRVLALISLAWLPAACVPAPASAQGDHVLWLYGVFLVAAAFVLAIVWGFLSWTVVRHRAARHRTPDGQVDDALPPQVHGSLRLEILWTVFPAITIAFLFAVTVAVLGAIGAREAGPLSVHVEGHRWGWRFSYPDAGVEVWGEGIPGPEMVLPVGEPIELTLTAVDVIHAFYVPAFLAKYDLIPGRERVVPLRIDSPGTWGGQCAEFCGLLHSAMPFTVTALAPDAFDAWLAARAQP